MSKEEVVQSEDKFVVRLFDGFDNIWIDVSKPVSFGEAKSIWNERTKNGTKNTCFDDIDYYRIFQADTIMCLSDEGRKLNAVG